MVSPADQQRIAHRDRQGRADHHLQQRGVRGQARNDFAGACHFEETRLESQHLGEQRLAQIRHHPFPDPGDQIDTGRHRNRHHRDHHQEQRQRLIQRRTGTAAEPVIHHPLQNNAETQQRSRRHQQCQRGTQHSAPVGTQKAE